MIQRYTLMEILVVAAIIAILAGIAIPGAMTARRYARESAAVAEIQSIATAMKRFEAEYGEGVYPEKNSSDSNTWWTEYNVGTDKALRLKEDSYDKFFSALTGSKLYNGKIVTFADPDWDKDKDWGNNKKHIKFLDPKANGGKFVFKSGNDSKEYQIFVDSSGNGKINLTTIENSPRAEILTNIAIFVVTSKIKNKDGTTYRFATSWGGLIQKTLDK